MVWNGNRYMSGDYIYNSQLEFSLSCSHLNYYNLNLNLNNSNLLLDKPILLVCTINMQFFRGGNEYLKDSRCNRFLGEISAAMLTLGRHGHITHGSVREGHALEGP